MMENILQFGLSLVLYLQGLGSWLVAPMRLFTFTGEEQFFLLIMPMIYWSVDPGLGIRIGVALLLSNGLNGAFKLAFHSPRPFWVDPRVHALRFEDSFGIPSGHAQNAAAVWGMVGAVVRRGWVWVVMILLVFLVGISRLVLGMHFPSDVIAGWLIGAAVVWVILSLEAPARLWLARHSLGFRLLAAFAASLALVLIGFIARYSLGDWKIPALWLENAARAYPNLEAGDSPINALALSGFFTASGAFFGLTAGAILIASSGGFDARGAWWKRLLRFFVGLAGVLLFWQALGMLLPDGEYLLAYVLRYLRYALTGLWISALAPMVFVQLGLADRPIPPEKKPAVEAA